MLSDIEAVVGDLGPLVLAIAAVSIALRIGDTIIHWLTLASGSRDV